MVRYETAIFRGGGDTFRKNQPYAIAVKTRWWSKKVSMYQRHGYYDAMQEGTLRHYSSWEDFTANWQIKEETNG